MSNTSVMKILRNGDVVEHRSLKKSYLGAMKVWMVINSKYEYENSTMFFEPFKTWGNSLKGIHLPFEDVVMASTFDFRYFGANFIPLMMKSLEEYSHHYGSGHQLEMDKTLMELEMMKK